MKDIKQMDLIMRNKTGQPLCTITRDLEHNCPKIIIIQRQFNKMKDELRKHFGTKVVFYLATNHGEMFRVSTELGLDYTTLTEIKFLENDQIMFNEPKPSEETVNEK